MNPIVKSILLAVLPSPPIAAGAAAPALICTTCAVSDDFVDVLRSRSSHSARMVIRTPDRDTIWAQVAKTRFQFGKTGDFENRAESVMDAATRSTWFDHRRELGATGTDLFHTAEALVDDRHTKAPCACEFSARGEGAE
jgi:hypothetical protein